MLKFNEFLHELVERGYTVRKLPPGYPGGLTGSDSFEVVSKYATLVFYKSFKDSCSIKRLESDRRPIRWPVGDWWTEPNMSFVDCHFPHKYPKKRVLRTIGEFRLVRA